MKANTFWLLILCSVLAFTKNVFGAPDLAHRQIPVISDITKKLTASLSFADTYQNILSSPLASLSSLLSPFSPSSGDESNESQIVDGPNYLETLTVELVRDTAAYIVNFLNDLSDVALAVENIIGSMGSERQKKKNREIDEAKLEAYRGFLKNTHLKTIDLLQKYQAAFGEKSQSRTFNEPGSNNVEPANGKSDSVSSRLNFFGEDTLLKQTNSIKADLLGNKLNSIFHNDVLNLTGNHSNNLNKEKTDNASLSSSSAISNVLGKIAKRFTDEKNDKKSHDKSNGNQEKINNSVEIITLEKLLDLEKAFEDWKESVKALKLASEALQTSSGGPEFARLRRYINKNNDTYNNEKKKEEISAAASFEESIDFSDNKTAVRALGGEDKNSMPVYVYSSDENSKIIPEGQKSAIPSSNVSASAESAIAISTRSNASLPALNSIVSIPANVIASADSTVNQAVTLTPFAPASVMKGLLNRSTSLASGQPSSVSSFSPASLPVNKLSLGSLESTLHKFNEKLKQITQNVGI